MNLRVIFALVLFSIFLGACSGISLFGERDDFIRVVGPRFVHNGRPYYYAGTNLWYGCYLGSPGETGDRARLLRELDSLNGHGLENLRVLAASEDSYVRGSMKPAIQVSAGTVDEDLLVGLDFLLAEMAKRHMHAVLYLNNYWEWSGGMAVYNVWANGSPGVDPDDTTKGWPAFMNFAATFYANEKANALYRDYIARIVKRKNTVNGRTYSEDPTIMSWQLANEPRPGTSSPEGEKNLEALYRWVEQTSAFIHVLDTNHLVSTGSEGTVGFRWSSEYCIKMHQSKHVDYVTFHVWPLNWSWFDPRKFEETLPRTEQNALEYIRTHLTLARQLNKPIVMEEFGLGRDGGLCAPGSPTTARDRYYSKIFAALYDSARSGAPFAGSNFWGWGGEGRGRNADNVWRKGDPFVGDPPQEPQGRNSIFNADRSTIGIIRDHAFKMRRLGTGDSVTVAERR
jgi:mannan endo-1,4-beta-mannosidase